MRLRAAVGLLIVLGYTGCRRADLYPLQSKSVDAGGGAVDSGGATGLDGGTVGSGVVYVAPDGDDDDDSLGDE